MAAVVTSERAIVEPPQAEAPAPRLFEPGGATLEEAVLGVWEDLVTQGRAECPVCGGAMAASGGCESCGTELA